MKLGKILVPLDGSSLAEAVLPKAVELAESSGARLLLLRAAEARVIPGADATEAQVKVVTEAEDYLAQVGDRLAALGVKDVETSVWYGPAAYAIVEAARLHKVDLIAMTTHGRSGLGRFILGSVAESVLRGTTTPILLIRVAEAPVHPPVEKGEARPWAPSQAWRP
ncbi:MAG: universal stress protein [Candidatus Rokubacteria bacterium]|nr:universal stress protein [Candidatus Rokubacteria bacterium]